MSRPSNPKPPTVAPDKGLTLLQKQHAEGLSIQSERVDPDAFKVWEITTTRVVATVFGEESPEHLQFWSSTNRVRLPSRHPFRDPEHPPYLWATAALKEYLVTLGALIKTQEIKVDQTPASSGDHLVDGAPTPRGVFLVHGRDHGSLETVARFLERAVGEDHVIVLKDRPSSGLTVIEKFEANSAEVGFAVVLLTPDDVGCLSEDFDTVTSIDQARSVLQRRARQNVVFELGFFVGRLRRARVCALVTGQVEIPSDYSGVVFIPMQDGLSWRFLLAKEMREAGYMIDMNEL